MAIYFGPVAPNCPVSRDQMPPDRLARLRINWPVFVRPTIPQLPVPRDLLQVTGRELHDISTVVNIARSIVSDLSRSKTINNTRDAKPQKPPKPPVDKFKNKAARWSEQTDKRVRKQYKYFAKDEDGNKDPDTWVVMERIERMVWYDRIWKGHLVWEYGDKGEGERFTGE
jgi:hypothetical protein